MTFAGRSRRGTRLADYAVRRVRLRRRSPFDVARKILGGGKSSSSRARSAHRRGGTRRPRPSVPPGCSSAAAPADPARARAAPPTPAAPNDRTPRSTGCHVVWPSSGASCVSPDSTAMRSRSTSSSSAAICASAVTLPWPSSTLPTAKPHGAIGLEAEPLLHAAVVLDRQRQSVAHAPFPSRSMAAAFSTARRIRGCAPQRQRCLSNAATMSARVGDGLRSSSALALITMPGQAVAALTRLLVEERLLQRMRLCGTAQPLDRRDAAPGDGADLARARIDRLAVEQHHAASALLQAAAVARALQIELVAQHVQQRRRLGAVTCTDLPFTVSAMSCAMAQADLRWTLALRTGMPVCS